ncbi:MAG: DNA polymerase beta [Alphaproteobacteria bacterium]|nr:DNA polymerase beta [Alphaproteobacteria bacterium]
MLAGRKPFPPDHFVRVEKTLLASPAASTHVRLRGCWRQLGSYGKFSADQGRLTSACQRFDVARFDVFGSAARGSNFDRARSDVDFSLDLEEDFERILGRKVDLIDPRAIKGSRNFIRQRSILEQAEPIYVA